MFFTKKNILLILAIVLLVAFTGCSNKPAAPATPAAPAAPAAPAQTQPITIKFSHNQPTTSPEHAGALKFKEVAEAKSNGKVKVEVYPAGQMGSLREQVEATQIGTIHVSMQPSAVISPFVDDIKVCDLPYIWPSDRQAAFKVLDGPVGRELLDRLEQGGFHGLGYWFGGYKLFTTKNKEIHSPSDFAGVKMRVMEAPILISQYKAWGANPIVLPYAELYNGLQQGIVDGQENPIQTIYLNNYQEVQKQIIQSYHGVMMYVMITNKAWFDKLPKDIQDVVVEAEKAGREEARKVFATAESDYIAKIKAVPGVHYYELTDAELKEFVKASLPVHQEHYKTEWQKQYLAKLYKAIEEAQK